METQTTFVKFLHTQNLWAFSKNEIVQTKPHGIYNCVQFLRKKVKDKHNNPFVPGSLLGW